MAHRGPDMGRHHHPTVPSSLGGGATALEARPTNRIAASLRPGQAVRLGLVVGPQGQGKCLGKAAQFPQGLDAPLEGHQALQLPAVRVGNSASRSAKWDKACSTAVAQASQSPRFTSPLGTLRSATQESSIPTGEFRNGYGLLDAKDEGMIQVEFAHCLG